MMLMETRFTSQFLTLKIIRFPLAIFLLHHAVYHKGNTCIIIVLKLARIYYQSGELKKLSEQTMHPIF